MSLLISLLIVLLVAGAVLYIVRLMVPALGLPPIIVQVAYVVVMVGVVLWLLRVLGAMGGAALP